MPLSDFRLSQDQGNTSFVVVLADDGGFRIVARIAREAIDDYFHRREPPQRERVALVERNLPQIGYLITKKYEAGDHLTYTDSLGLTEASNRLIIIDYNDLRSGQALSG